MQVQFGRDIMSKLITQGLKVTDLDSNLNSNQNINSLGIESLFCSPLHLQHLKQCLAYSTLIFAE